jgi:hypothetical protein
MSRKRHRPEEIVAKLRQVEVLTAQGRTVAEAIRSIGVTEVSSATSCSTARSSTRSRRPRSSSRAGAALQHPSPHSSLGYVPPAPEVQLWPAALPRPAPPATPAVALRPVMH